MNQIIDPSTPNPFDAETWALLPSFFDKLPNPIHLHVWADPTITNEEHEAETVGQTLAAHFEIGRNTTRGWGEVGMWF